jgi:MFS family permease
VTRDSDFVPALGGAYAFGYSFLALILAAQVQPALRAELNLPMEAIALVQGWTFFAAAVGGFLAGRLLDGGRRDAAFVLGALTTGAGLAVSAAAHDGPTFAAGRLMTGLGVGGGWGVAHAAVAAAVAPERRLVAAGIVQAAAPLGNVAALGLALLLDRGCSWRAVLATGAAFGLFGFALPAAFRGRALPAPRPGGALGDGGRGGFDSKKSSPTPPPTPSAALDAKGVRGAVTASADEGATDAARAGASRPIGAEASDEPNPAASRRAALVLFSLLAFHMGAFWLFYAWIPEWLERDQGRPRSFVRGVQLSLCVGFLLGDLVFPVVARRTGLRRSFVGASLLFAAGVAAVPKLVAWSEVSWVGRLLLAATGAAAGLWSAFGPFYGAHVAAAKRGRTASAAYQAARAGQLVMQPAVPFLRELGGFPAVFLAAAACSLLGGLGAFLLPATPRRVDRGAESRR